MTLNIKWHDAFREPQVQPDPRFPEGVDIDVSMTGEPSCETWLPYPAARCGNYIIECDRCGLVVGVTTAGRPDDPRSLKVRCKL